MALKMNQIDINHLKLKSEVSAVPNAVLHGTGNLDLHLFRHEKYMFLHRELISNTF